MGSGRGKLRRVRTSSNSQSSFVYGETSEDIIRERVKAYRKNATFPSGDDQWLWIDIDELLTTLDALYDKSIEGAAFAGWSPTDNSYGQLRIEILASMGIQEKN